MDEVSEVSDLGDPTDRRDLGSVSRIPDAYVVERVQEALVHDARVGELGLVIEVRDDRIVVRGVVSTTERHLNVGSVVRDALRDLGDLRPVTDETRCIGATDTSEAEEVR